MRLQRIQEMVFHRPWLITPTGHASIRALVEQKLHRLLDEPKPGKQASDDDDDFYSDFFPGRPKPTLENGIGHVHITGVIGIGFSRIEKSCGNTDTVDLLSEVQALIGQGAEKLMVHVDSPGGTVGGVLEAGNELADLEIPWFAYIGPGAMDCSAAYWLTCGADRMYGSDSSEAGSIGVYLPWTDFSAYYADFGVKVDLITNKEGDLKGAGYPGTSLSKEQRADWQEGVQQIFDLFAAHVRANRPAKISSDSLRGQSFLSFDAYERGLIDGVVGYETALRALSSFRR